MRAPDLASHYRSMMPQLQSIVVMPLDGPYSAASYGKFSEVTCFFNADEDRYCVTLRCKEDAKSALVKAAMMRGFKGEIGPEVQGQGGEKYRVIIGEFIACPEEILAGLVRERTNG